MPIDVILVYTLRGELGGGDLPWSSWPWDELTDVGLGGVELLGSALVHSYELAFDLTEGCPARPEPPATVEEARGLVETRMSELQLDWAFERLDGWRTR